MSKIVTNLKASYRSAEHDSYVKSSINEILDDANFLCEIKARRQDIKLNIMNKNKTDDIKINCRPVQITQIVQNLIINSIDQLEHNDEKWINVSFEKTSNSFVEIKVEDSGSGIAEDLQNKIFDALFTTKIDNRGTGLGLSISKRLAEEHGGYLKLDTSSDNTTFVLGLPISV